eukprot:8992402-Pyramimonas_sp.AAC.1
MAQRCIASNVLHAKIQQYLCAPACFARPNCAGRPKCCTTSLVARHPSGSTRVSETAWVVQP